MRAIVEFLVHARILDFASDPRVIVAAAVLFVVALFLRWKAVAISLFVVAALLVVAERSKLAEGKTAMDQDMLMFAVGSLLVIVVLIYLLFIRGD